MAQQQPLKGFTRLVSRLPGRHRTPESTVAGTTQAAKGKQTKQGTSNGHREARSQSTIRGQDRR
jgi:hypothetical protein